MQASLRAACNGRLLQTLDLTMRTVHRRLLKIGAVLSPFFALYCFGGVIQAASLFVGERAQRNFELWGGLTVFFLVTFVACAVTLVVTKHRSSKLQHDGGVTSNIAVERDAPKAARPSP